MRRRPVNPPAGFLFNGKSYVTAAKYQAAKDARDARRRSLLARIEDIDDTREDDE